MVTGSAGRNLTSVVVIGAGIGGLRSVEALRREGYSRRLTLVGAEPDPPYDRPPLSKDILSGASEPSSAILRREAELADLDVELRLGAPARELDLRERTVTVQGTRLTFDGLIIATGATPRILQTCDGRENAFVLRSLRDAIGLRAALERADNVLVVGGGVIGCEIAASARTRGLEVTVVEPLPTLMTRSIGPQMGAICAVLHREQGTTVRCSTTITQVEGGSRIDQVSLSDGSVIEPDAVVVGIGVEPATAWATGGGLRAPDGFYCDATLNVGHPSVFAVGDVANWPNQHLGVRMRCEQWTNAVQQARHAARNLLAGPRETRPFTTSNYFWSDQYGVRMQFAGSPAADEVRIVDGSIDERRFVAWYRLGARLTGVLAFSSPHLFGQTKLLVDSHTPWAAAMRRLPHLHASRPATTPPEAGVDLNLSTGGVVR